MIDSRRRHAERGFTLIELLVVIAIIGILASIVLASLASSTAKGRDAKRVSELRQLQTVLELYYQTCGRYPLKLDATTFPGCPTGTNWSTFIKSMPVDPSDKILYNYASFGTGVCNGINNPGKYHLGASLETNSPVLAADSDTPAGTACTGSNADFNGNDGSSCAVAGKTGNSCFDVVQL